MALCGQDDDNVRSHRDVGKPEIKRSENRVSAVYKTIGMYGSMFDDEIADDELIKLSTRQKCPDDIAKEILNYRTLGEERFVAFVKERLVCVPDSTPPSPLKPFSAPISRKKLRNMRHMNATPKKTPNTESVAHLQDVLWTVLSRNDALPVEQRVSMPMLMKYQLTDFPFAMSDAAGLYYKNTKAQSRNFMVDNLHTDCFLTNCPSGALHIIDGNAEFHKLKYTRLTKQNFEGICELLFLQCPLTGDVIVSFDVYWPVEGQATPTVSVIN